MGRFFECYIKWRQHLQYYSFILTEKLVIYFPGDPLFPILPYEIEEAEEDVEEEEKGRHQKNIKAASALHRQLPTFAPRFSFSRQDHTNCGPRGNRGEGHSQALV